MREMFVPKEFTLAHGSIIRKANGIIAEFAEMGFSLTLRQLYYQFVARDIIPNNLNSYKRLGDIINDARLAGRVDWDAIEDRTRFLRDYTTFENPQAAIDDMARRYLEDLWEDQDNYVEVWIEKDALIGVVEPVCGRWRLPSFACRGYTSQSEAYVAGKRLQEKVQLGKRVTVLHLGDHDPSGIDMTRDNRARIEMFADEQADDITIKRLALNMDQIQQYRPPENPAKPTDSRYRDYCATYATTSSWELDALDPKVIDGLIDVEIKPLLDMKRWDKAVKKEKRNRDLLKDAKNEWPTLVKFLPKWVARRAR